MANLKVFKKLTVILWFFPLLAWAESAGFSGEAIFFQVLNFSLFAGAFIFLLRKPIQAFFHKRQEEFFSFEKQALQLEKERQEEYKKWKEKLISLEDQEKNIKQKAQIEGEKFLAQKKEELKALQTRLEKEADFFIHLEKEKAKTELLKVWKNKIVESVEKSLEQEVQKTDFQKKTIKDFFQQMEARL